VVQLVNRDDLYHCFASVDELISNCKLNEMKRAKQSKAKQRSKEPFCSFWGEDMSGLSLLLRAYFCDNT
jgi:hypothetical protein